MIAEAKRQQQSEGLEYQTRRWKRLKIGDVVNRVDADYHGHVAIVRAITKTTITVQDAYARNHVLGWTEGGENMFTYETTRHYVDERVHRPKKDDDLFDDEIEDDMCAGVDNDRDGRISFNEFRIGIRHKVGRQPSVRAAAAAAGQVRRRQPERQLLQRPGARDAQAVRGRAPVERRQLYRKRVLKLEVPMCPVFLTGPADPRSKGYIQREIKYQGEEKIAEALKRVVKRSLGGAAEPGAWKKMMEAAEDGDFWRTRALRLVVQSAEGVVASDPFGASDPFVIVKADQKKVLSASFPRIQTCNPTWNAECMLRACRALLVEVFDKDLAGKDFLGGAALSRKQLRETLDAQTAWERKGTAASSR